jgi:hypothetical protein
MWRPSSMVVQPNIYVVNYLDGNNVEAVCHDRESSRPLPESTS